MSGPQKKKDRAEILTDWQKASVRTVSNEAIARIKKMTIESIRKMLEAEYDFTCHLVARKLEDDVDAALEAANSTMRNVYMTSKKIAEKEIERVRVLIETQVITE